MLNELIQEDISNYNENKELLDSKEYYARKFLDRHLHHYQRCKYYERITKYLFGTDFENQKKRLDEIPFIPVKLFKELNLLSIDKDKIYKTLHSSGTTGYPSKIFLDKMTSKFQVLALSKIFNDYIKYKRPVMLAFDTKDSFMSSKTMNAKKAALLGFGQMCKSIKFVIKSDNTLNYEELEKAYESTKNKYLFFGFTSTVWETIHNTKLPSRIKEGLGKNTQLLHGGGWKKLENLNISKKEFKHEVKEKLGITNIVNYYGMVEQTGTVFMECSHGRLHCNPLSAIISREQNTLEMTKRGEYGQAQVLSLIPYSYPGHSILTDDIVRIYDSKCACGRKGESFEILGRKQNVEIRGCSDSY